MTRRGEAIDPGSMVNDEMRLNQQLNDLFERLAAHFGPLHWWPADTPFEVAAGAILTQNTAWRNVELALANLRREGVLHPEGLRNLARERLEALIRPAGYYRQKAERLQLLVEYLFLHHRGRIEELLLGCLGETRGRLLELKGIGPETADSILLYAGGQPSFVVDSYTRRLFSRLGLIQGNEGYEIIRSLFMENLPHDTALFNEYHALIVEQCKGFCRKRDPVCSRCPLLTLCPTGLHRTADSR